MEFGQNAAAARLHAHVIARRRYMPTKQSANSDLICTPQPPPPGRSLSMPALVFVASD